MPGLPVVFHGAHGLVRLSPLRFGPGRRGGIEGAEPARDPEITSGNCSIFRKKSSAGHVFHAQSAISLMRSLLSSFFVFLTLVAGVGRAEEITELERAIRELPPRFVADISIANRDAFIRSLQRDSSDRRLDLKNGFLHFYSDNSAEGLGATSMLYMRQYRRANGGFVVLTHMPKPFGKGSAPRENQTFVIARRNGVWKDITAEVFPRGIDLTAHFRPQRTSRVVEFAPYARIQRQDGNGETWIFGSREADFSWDGREFQKHDASDRNLSKD